jgi:hypothetical protein
MYIGYILLEEGEQMTQRLKFSSEGKTYPIKLDDDYRAMLTQLMAHHQTTGASVIRFLIRNAARELRKEARRQAKQEDNGKS